MFTTISLGGQKINVIDNGYTSASGKSKVVGIRVEDPVFSGSQLVSMAVKPDTTAEQIVSALQNVEKLFVVEFVGQEGKAAKRAFTNELAAKDFLALTTGEVVNADTVR